MLFEMISRELVHNLFWTAEKCSAVQKGYEPITNKKKIHFTKSILLTSQFFLEDKKTIAVTTFFPFRCSVPNPYITKTKCRLLASIHYLILNFRNGYTHSHILCNSVFQLVNP